MRNFRRLPPLLRVASILGLLFALAAMALSGWSLITGLSSMWQSAVPADSSRVLAFGLNLGMLGGACAWATQAYTARVRWPGATAFALDSWYGQLRAIGMLAALPLLSLVLASLISPSRLAGAIAAPISVLAAAVLVVAFVWLAAARRQ